MNSNDGDRTTDAMPRRDCFVHVDDGPFWLWMVRDLTARMSEALAAKKSWNARRRIGPGCRTILICSTLTITEFLPRVAPGAGSVFAAGVLSWRRRMRERILPYDAEAASA